MTNHTSSEVLAELNVFDFGENLRFAIISDIHGNIHALNSVLDSIAKENPDQIICLGDIIGYGAFPNECVSVIIDKKIPTIMGNHDSVGSGKENPDIFNRYARQSILWTASKLKDEYRDFIQNLKYTMNIPDTLCVHSTPYRPELWFYILTITEAFFQFQSFSEKLCFIGHSHQPLVIDNTGEIFHPYDYPYTFEIQKDIRYLINVGSIGQPRDRDKRASYVIYNNSEQSVTFHRVDYDIKAAQKAIMDIKELSNEVTQFLSVRLNEGE